MDLLDTLQEILCRFGIHDFRIIEATYGFGDAGGVEKVECRHCGTTMVREQSPRE